MSISSVVNHPYSGASMVLYAARGHQGHRCNCEGAVAEPSVNADVGDEPVRRAESHDHRGHGGHHGHHGHGFGFGRYGMGIGHFINEQMRDARREVAGEQIGEAVADLTTKVAEVIGTAGQTEGLGLAQENFAAAVQDVVDRFDSGEIGRRHAMAGFRAAFEDLVDAVHAGPAGDKPVVEEAVPAEINAEDAGAATPVEPEAVAGESSNINGSLVENLGQVFSSFMQGLRSDFAALGGMRSFMSPENRDKILETFVSLYRELAGLDTGERGAGAESAGVDQLV